MRIVAMSDTHMQHDSLIVPDGDVLVHAGDATNFGKIDEFSRFAKWFRAHPHAFKLFVPGNHDWFCQRAPDIARQMLGDARMLVDEMVQVTARSGGPLHFFGSPWVPWEGSVDDWAFLHAAGSREMFDARARIPPSCDVLISHAPARGILDWCGRELLGCHELAGRLRRLEDDGPSVHIHGHIHEAAGVSKRGRLVVNTACRVTVVEV